MNTRTKIKHLTKRTLLWMVLEVSVVSERESGVSVTGGIWLICCCTKSYSLWVMQAIEGE